MLTDGTYFINRWFATVEFKPKTVIPIGYVGVVVSYYGHLGEDLTGEQFRYGEQVERGRRGVWRKPLPPGKYPLNPYALKVELVPTVNFVLRWITGMVEEHQYDKDLSSIALITADGYEPLLPLSLVLHIDYEMAPRVVQRFGDVQAADQPDARPDHLGVLPRRRADDADARPADAAARRSRAAAPRSWDGASATTTSPASRC